jgi:hypothetical protein
MGQRIKAVKYSLARCGRTGKLKKLSRGKAVSTEKRQQLDTVK